MKLKYLFPHRFKKIGWFVLIPTLLAGLSVMYLNFEPDFFNIKVFAILNDGFLSEGHNFQFITDNVFNEIIGILLIISSLMIAFSRQKVYGISFFNVMTFNLFTILFFFIIRFNWELLKLKKAQKNEE